MHINKNKHITIVGEFRFPTGDAASVRVLGIAKTLRENGYNVSFIGKTWGNENENHKGKFEGFDFYNVLVLKSAFLKSIYKLFTSGYQSLKLLRENFPYTDIIIYYGSSARYLYPLLKFSKKKRIKLVVDIVEWYDSSHVMGGKYGPIALDVNLGMTKLIPKSSGVIAISSFLKNYYTSKGLKSIRIPQVIDLQDTKWEIRYDSSFDKSCLNIIYAGIPGKKDLVSVAILGIRELMYKGINVKLHLLGPSKDDILRLFDGESRILDELNELLVFHGRISQEDIPKLLIKADYSILIRPNLRFANAGFSTKFVESFAIGLPVIANLTSDMGLYLKHGINGFVMKDESVNSFIESVKCALSLSTEEIMTMRNAAKKQALEFDYRQYAKLIDKFLLEI
jgi:glycosyltransferase involved in cell wall biosynthesis